MPGFQKECSKLLEQPGEADLRVQDDPVSPYAGYTWVIRQDLRGKQTKGGSYVSLH
jgi:hypothetical protein